MIKTEKLSILLVSSYAFSEVPGGVKDFILGLKEALRKNGCKVFVIAPGSKDAQKKGLVDFVLGMDFKVVTDQTEFRASLSRKKTARKILSVVKPDIIVIHEPFVPSIGHTIISSLTRIKGGRKYPIIVGQFHASREDFNWWLKVTEFVIRHFIRRPKLDRRTILGLSSGYVSTINNNLDGRIAVSQATKGFWQKKLPARLPSPEGEANGGQADYKVICNGIDTNKLTFSGPKMESWMKDGKRIILFAGRHDHRKGIDDLISAFKILVQDSIDDIRLKITGKGEMTEALRKMVEKLGLQKLVEFVGVLSSPQLIKAYRTADLVVAPSTGGEGFNRTIIEARSCGTLVVCTNVGGQNEAIGEDLSPFMAEPKDPRSLAKQIMTVLNLKETKKQEIRKRGRKDVESRFSWDKVAKEHILYYKSLISRQR